MKTMKFSLAFVFSTLCSISALAAAATWINTTANTPDTPHLWSNASNWQDSHVCGMGDDATINGGNAPVFIKVDTQATPHTLKGNDNAYLLGDIYLKSIDGSTLDEKRAYYRSSNRLYGDLVLTAENMSDQHPYIGNAGNDKAVNLCGRIRHSAGASGRLLVSSGTVRFLFNRYARSADRCRTDDFSELGHFGSGNGDIFFCAPEGAEAVSGTWRLTEGSPFAYRVSDAHDLAVGTVVSPDNAQLPANTFLKHVFNDATIELSAPATESGDATLSFAEFTPDFTATVENAFYLQGNNTAFIAPKKRASDASRIVFNEIRWWYKSAKLHFGTATNDVHGTFTVRKISGDGSEGQIVFRSADIEFPDSIDIPVPCSVTSGTETCISIPDGTSVSIASLTNFNGTIVKSGGGSLTIGLDDAINAGSIKVADGTLAIVKNASAGDSIVSFNKITVADGATLSVPADGLRADAVEKSIEATITGGILYRTLDSAPEEGALVDALPAEGEVVGHPAFWVDASKLETIEFAQENGTNFVTRWNDCRQGEPMFCTNITLRPTLHTGDAMKEKYVRIANHDVTDYRATEILAWSEPVTNICAIFLVQDPTEGGGEILGRCSWRLDESYCNGSWGGPFYRENEHLFNSPLVADSIYTVPETRYGRFYLNGNSIDGKTTGYLGAFMQIVEHHPNYSYHSCKVGVACDAFGGGYRNNEQYVNVKNGRMRIAECIIYTNALSNAERTSVAQYLSRKWLGRDVRFCAADASITSDISEYASAETLGVAVSAGRTAAAKPVASGSVVKSGDGTLYMEGLDDASLDVRQGGVVLQATRLRRYVPNDTWIHVDADSAESVVTDSSGFLTQWNDIGTSGASYRNCLTPSARVVQNAIGGRTAIDLGPCNSDDESAGLLLYNADGEPSLNYNAHPNTMDAPSIRTFIAVYGSQSGGGALFGGAGNCYPSKGLPHRHSNDDASPIIDEPKYVNNSSHGLPALKTALKNGTASFRRNGVAIDPFTEPFTKGDELVTFTYREGRKTTHLGAYGQNADCHGGLKYGEVILFERVLSASEIAATEAYLTKKWFGVDTPGYGSAADAVSVAAGTTLTILGTDFSVTSLGGCGTVDGDVTIAANGGITAVVNTDGSVSGPTVTGDVTLNGGTVTIAGDAESIVPGNHTILNAASISGSANRWTVAAPTRKRSYGYAVTLTDTAMVLHVYRFGLRAIIR